MQVIVLHRISPDKFNRLMTRLVKATPPCLSNADDWGKGAATLEELSAELDAGGPNHFPEPSGEWRRRGLTMEKTFDHGA